MKLITKLKRKLISLLIRTEAERREIIKMFVMSESDKEWLLQTYVEGGTFTMETTWGNGMEPLRMTGVILNKREQEILMKKINKNKKKCTRGL